MNAQDWIAIVSIITAGLTVAGGAFGAALGEGRALGQGLDAISRQPDAASTISRTLFVGLAMVESSAIYPLVIGLILLFANPFVQ